MRVSSWPMHMSGFLGHGVLQGAWGPLCRFLGLQLNCPEVSSPMVSISISQGLRVVFFLKASPKVHCNGSAILESFAEPIPSFVPHWWVQAKPMSSHAPRCSLAALHSFILDKFDTEVWKSHWRKRVIVSPEIQLWKMIQRWRTKNSWMQA